MHMFDIIVVTQTYYTARKQRLMDALLQKDSPGKYLPQYTH